MAILYGILQEETPSNGANFRYDAIGKNSEVIAVGDPLTISSGVLSVAGTTNTIVGIAVKAATMSSTNQTVAKVSPGYTPISPDDLYVMGSNGDFTGNATDGGTYYKLTGTTGVVQVDQASGVQTGANRVVEIIEVDPFNIGGSGSGSGLRQVVVKVVKTPNLNVSITS